MTDRAATYVRLSDRRVEEMQRWVAEYSLPTGRTFGAQAVYELLEEIVRLRSERVTTGGNERVVEMGEV